MRIISGKYRGLKLAEFEGSDIRPTADRVKESLFNIIADRIQGASVLDLFCGSGGLGLECISRGADFVHFNDISSASLAVLEKNIKKIKVTDGFKVTKSDYSLCLSRADGYDLIFIDPPYNSDAGVSALEIIGCKKLLKNNGIAVYERDRAFFGAVEGLKIADERKYGKTYLTFFEADA